MPSFPARLLPLLYLAGPTLPVGAFAWSQGLETACAEGAVRDAASLKERLLTLLHFGLERFDLPVFLRCCAAAGKGATEEFLYWDRLIFAGRESAELWLEEEQTGKALCRLLREQGMWPESLRDRVCGYTAAFALAATGLAPCPGDGQDAACAYAWNRMESQANAACRCLPLGQSAVQRVLLDIMPAIAGSVGRATRTADEDIGSSLPGTVLASCRHERQYSRMFRS
ncbi:MAG: urease accessory protein UreF [Desulfovibrio sp.]|jgi:urease accessory protein|nr:urease accessory protein UreF [Desulfovibrio sp.]